MMRPLLLLHPLGSSGSFWDDIAARWPGPVLRPDLPGHGTAPLPEVSEGVPGMTRHVVAELESAGLAGQLVDVVGVSLGGLVAQELAGTHPDRVGRVVLADTVVRYPEAMLATWEQRAETARRSGTAVLADATLDVWFTPEFRGARPDVVAQVEATLAATDDEGYARTCEVLAGADTSEALDRITAPVLAVCGEHDGEPFRRAAAEQLAPLGGRDVVWLPGRHAVPLEHPVEFLLALLGFLPDPQTPSDAPTGAPTPRSTP